MRRLRILLLLLAASSSAAAQERVRVLNGQLTAGARVRVFGADGRRLVGRIGSISDDSIEVQEQSGAFTVASLGEVDSLEVHGRSTTAATVLGTLGFVAGTAMYVSWCGQNRQACEDEEQDYDGDGEEDEFSTFKALAFGTAGIGILLGHVLTPPGWHRVSIHVWITPAPGGGAALHFRVPVSARWR